MERAIAAEERCVTSEAARAEAVQRAGAAEARAQALLAENERLRRENGEMAAKLVDVQHLNDKLKQGLRDAEAIYLNDFGKPMARTQACAHVHVHIACGHVRVHVACGMWHVACLMRITF